MFSALLASENMRSKRKFPFGQWQTLNNPFNPQFFGALS